MSAARKAGAGNSESRAGGDHGSLAEEIALRYITSPPLQAQTRRVALRRLELLYDVWTLED